MTSSRIHVLHMSTSDLVGGASLAAFRMHRLMLGSELVVSRMVVLNKTSDDATIREIKSLHRLAIILRSKISRMRLRLRYGSGVGYISSHKCAARVEGLGLEQRDITHLHWVQGGFVDPSTFSRIEDTLIWTLHDMWPILGLRHYDEGNPSSGFARTEELALNRIIGCMPEKLVLHCTTKWMADKVRESRWGNHAVIEVIPYPVGDVYLEYKGPSQFRQGLDARDNDIVILFGAINATSDARKGFDLALEALKNLQSNTRSVKVVLFGCERIDDESRRMIEKFSPVCTGYISSEHALADIYGAADIMLIPSRIEAFGQTAIEAQACGVPVICFSKTGVSELVEDGVTGFVIPAFSTTEITTRLSQIIESPESLARMKIAARDRARRLWASKVVLGLMENMYRKALDLS